MKQPGSTLLALILTSILACTNKNISGIYVCEDSNKKADTTIHHGTYDEVHINATCILSEIDFKGSTTVQLTVSGSQIASSYVIDKDYIRIKGTGSDILLKRKDQNTLIGEGIFQGVYHKK